MSRIGKTVLYTLSEQDVKEIVERRRLGGAAILKGNTPHPDQEYPALIVADWGGSVNLRVILDGYEDHWATSRAEFDPDGHFKATTWLLDDDGDRVRPLGDQEVRDLAGPNDVGAGQASRTERVLVEQHAYTWREIPTA